MTNKMKLADLKNETILSSGRTIWETEAEAQKIISKLYADTFGKGIPLFYKDERTKILTQFIRANPDGSEDLVNFDSANREYEFLKNLVPKRQGHWSFAELT